jgi:hypothetical protein
MPHPGVKTTVIFTQVVMPRNAAVTVAATLPGFACHAVTDAKPEGVLTDCDDLARPFMAGDEGICRRPEPGNPPAIISGSVPQMATARMRQSTSNGPGDGTATVRISNFPGAVNTSAFIVEEIVAFIRARFSSLF